MEFSLEDMKAGASEAVGLMKALAHEGRLLVMCSLCEKERSVGELVEITGLSQSALSQHLAKLREDKMVETRRQAQSIYYRLAGKGPREIIETLHGLYCPDDDDDNDDQPPHTLSSD